MNNSDSQAASSKRLTSATDAMTFDAVATRIRDTVLPKLCAPLQQYYTDKLEPLL